MRRGMNFFRFVREPLYRIGELLARPKGVDWREYVRRGRMVDFAMLFFLVAVIALGFTAPIKKFFEEAFASRPALEIPRADWMVVWDGGPECGGGASCYASPVSSPLRTAKASLADKDFTMRARAAQGTRFWAGYWLDGSRWRGPFGGEAWDVVVGHINATYRIYVNGDIRRSGDGNDFLPVSFALTPADWARASGVLVAVEVTHTLGSAWPLAVGAPYPTGVFSQQGAKDFRNLWVTTTIARPLAFGITGLVVFAVFLFLWASVPDRAEYLAFSLFALCLCAIQIMHWGVVKWTMSISDFYLTDLGLRFSEGVLGAVLGLAYARARKDTVYWVFGVGLIAFTVAYRSATQGSDFFFLSAQLAKWLVPFMYFVGALACFSQAEFVKRLALGRGGDRKMELRAKRTVQFGVVLGFIFGMYLIQTGLLGNGLIGLQAVYHRPLQFLLVAILGAFIFRDYREFDFVQETLVGSRFHDPMAKEQRVFQGILLHVDLKASSRLYDVSAEKGLATKLPTRWCEAATGVMKAHGGEHISSGGDSFFGFFPGESAQVLTKALDALQAMEKMGVEFEKESGAPIHFRAALVAGGIHPIYKTVSGKRFEDFEDAPGETGFKDVARILECEKALCEKSKSVLVLEEKLVFGAKGRFELLKREKASVRDVGTRDLFFFELSGQVKTGKISA